MFSSVPLKREKDESRDAKSVNHCTHSSSRWNFFWKTSLGIIKMNNAFKNKGPRPVWPLFVGAGAVVAGYTFVKNRKTSIQHHPATPFTKEQTRVQIKKTGES
jgi:hypothetical protein